MYLDGAVGTDDSVSVVSNACVRKRVCLSLVHPDARELDLDTKAKEHGVGLDWGQVGSGNVFRPRQLLALSELVERIRESLWIGDECVIVQLLHAVDELPERTWEDERAG